MASNISLADLPKILSRLPFYEGPEDKEEEEEEEEADEG